MSIQQRDQIKSGRVHLRATTTKEDSVSRQSSREIRSNRVGFTYFLQRPKKTASAVNPAERSDQIRSGSLTSYNDQRRQRQQSIQQRDQIKSSQVHLLPTTTKEDSVSRQSSREIRSNQVRFTYFLQRPKKIASAVNPAERSDQIGSGSLTSYNDLRRQRQPSIQQRDQIKSSRVHLRSTATKEGRVSRQSSREIRSNRVGFT